MRMLWIYLAVAIPFWLADAIWLGSTGKMYRAALGPLMARKFKVVPALLFYAAFPIGLALFVLSPGLTSSWPLVQTAAMGGLFGLFCYGTYDLVNHATLKDWPLKITLIDMAWGTFASALAVTIGARLMG